FSVKRKIKPSPAMLGAMMASVFSDEVAAWQDARRAGSTLGDHLVAERMREEREAEAAHRAKFGPPPDAAPASPPREPAPDAPSEISDVSTSDLSITSVRDPDDDFNSPNADHTIDETLDWDPRSSSELEELPTTVHQAVRKASEPEETQAGSSRAARVRSQSFGTGQRHISSSTSLTASSGSSTQIWRWPPPPRAMWLAGGTLLVVVAAIWLMVTALH
ncbi:MAG TPA: hypothetical protein VFP84_29680, partial [Kofleriaceae bacterium]|nr:hypothetical protein [Kofleriaceae bacterium]